MNTREKFVKAFNEQTAQKIEACASEHGNGVNNKNKGSDPFKNALLIVIGYECVSREKFFKYHKFDKKVISPFRFERWCKNEAELDKHDGDCDYLTLAGGGYRKFMPSKEIR